MYILEIYNSYEDPALEWRRTRPEMHFLKGIYILIEYRGREAKVKRE